MWAGRVRSLEHLWIRRAIPLLLFFQFLSVEAGASVVYIRLDYETASGAGCGDSTTNPCTNIRSALQERSSSGAAGNVTTVVLLPGSGINHQSLGTLEHMYGVQNVVIAAGQPKVPINVTLRRNQTWLVLDRCENVTIDGLSLTWSQHYFGTAIHLRHSSTVTVSDSVFAGLHMDSHALFVDNSWPVTVRNTYLHGLEERPSLPVDSKFNYTLSALRVVYSCVEPYAVNCGNTSKSRITATSNHTHSLLVEATSFHRLGFKEAATNLHSFSDFQGLLLHSSAVNIDISSDVMNKTIVFGGCSFTSMSSPNDPAIRVALADHSRENLIRFDGCKFLENRASLGAVFYVKIGADTTNSIRLSGGGSYGVCNFSNNLAFVESAVGRISFAEKFSLSERSTRFFIDNCYFSRNLAGAFIPLCGGCFTATTHSLQHSANQYTTSNGPSPTSFHIQVVRSHFDNNAATLGSAFYLQKTSARFVNCTFSNQVGTAVFADSSIISLADSTRFIKNGKQIASAGGAIGLYQNSLVHIENGSTTTFYGNNAAVYGGSIYVDIQTSTSTLLQVVELITEVKNSFKPCFFNVPPELQVQFSNGTSSAQVGFEDNVSPFGRDIFATSFLACYGTPVFPLLGNNAPVAVLPKSTRHGAAGPPISTGPAWLLFNSSTCSCLKQLANTSFWLYYRNCNGMVITDQFYKEEDIGGSHNIINAAINATVKYITDWTVDVLLPPRTRFLLPWGTVLWRFNYMNLLGNAVAQQIANLTLYPAPGEEFTLSLDTLDSRLYNVQVTLLLSVRSANALLRYGGLQFQVHDYISFPSQHPLVDVSLAGKPGTAGTLFVQSTGIIAQHPFYLEIPFRLRPCHTGWMPTADMKKSDAEVLGMIRNNSATVSITAPGSLNQLICACSDPVLTTCSSNGYNVTVSSRNWAGLAHVETTQLYTQPARSTIVNLTAYEENEVYEGNDFQVQSCSRTGDFCSRSLDVDWPLRSTNPCIAVDNRTGLLCAACQDGTTLVALDAYNCRDCRSANLSAGGAGYFFLTLVFTFVLVALAFFFGVGSGATFDTWSFSFQLTQFLSPELQRSASGFTSIYYGADQCISQNLPPVHQLATSYIIPFHLLISLVTVYSLFRKVRWFRVKFASLSFFPALWSAIIWSYNYLVFISVLMLTCTSVDGKQVFYLQPLTECFTGSHLPFGILALLILLTVAIPVPVVLVALRKTTVLRPFANVYLAPLKEATFWWVGWAMLRRIGLVLFSVVLTGVARVAVTLVVLQLYVLVQFFVMPYRQVIDNYFELITLFLMSLQVMMLLLAPDQGLIIAGYVIFLIPSGIAFVIGLYHSRASLRQHAHSAHILCHRLRAKLHATTGLGSGPEAGGLGQCQSPLAMKDCREQRPRTASHYSFRDPLLFDTLQDIPE